MNVLTYNGSLMIGCSYLLFFYFNWRAN